MIRAGHHLRSVLVASLVFLSLGRALPRTKTPILPDRHFLFTWNAPTELCEIRFGLPLDLSHFDLVSSTLKTATDQSISIFYTDRFGIFPYVDEDTGETYDEGLPQFVDLREHREQAEDDIEYYIPNETRPGLAVLDFEEWRPQWIRNWGSKDIYRQISIETVKKKNTSLSDDEAEERAKVAFERAAKRYFLRSLQVGKRLRPGRLWGFYLYPDCYNYDYNQDMEGFTGECLDIEKSRNDQLLWLWRESTALFPSIYLELVLRDSRQARLYVRHRIREAVRVSTLPNSSRSIPIYAYIRPVYKDSVDDYLSEFDLVNTIGEAAALGAAGVVSWGDMNVVDTETETVGHECRRKPAVTLGELQESGTLGVVSGVKLKVTKDSCFDARRHLERIMNPYVLNVSTAAGLCSRALCGGRGRCVRKRWDDDVYLHLDPNRYWIERRRRGGPLSVSGVLSQADVFWFDRHFQCMCYGEEPCASLQDFNSVQESVAMATNRSVKKTSRLLLLFMVVWTSTRAHASAGAAAAMLFTSCLYFIFQ